MKPERRAADTSGETKCYRRHDDPNVYVLAEEDLKELHAIAQSSRVIRRVVIPIIAAIIGLMVSALTIIDHIQFTPHK